MKKNLFIIIINIYANAIGQIFSTSCNNAGIFLYGGLTCPTGDYYLAFEDNFDGNSLDLNKWELPYQGVSNDFVHSQSKYWCANTGNNPSIPFQNNIQISNGTLKIIAKHEVPPIIGTVISDWSTSPPTTLTESFDYSSGWIQTHKKFLYGKYEIRCRLPNGKGFWPAFWTYGGERWNEIDIFDNIEGNLKFSCGPGYDFDGTGSAEGCRWGTTDIPDLSEWHTYTCIYEKDRLVWLIDNETIHTQFCYTTVSNLVIECGEQIAAGTYYQEKSFPHEKMFIILDLAISSGDKTPDITTPFPSNFEIDYVRFYIKNDGPPCDGCINNISYENTNNLPSLTRASNYIHATNNVTVKNNQNVLFKAPTIVLSSGFSTESGSIFTAEVEDCNYLNYTDVAVNFLGDNSQNGTIDRCTNPVYSVEMSGVQFYSFQVTNLSGQSILDINSTMPTNNIINLWDVSTVSTGWYRLILKLKNCTDSLKREYNLLVNEASCRTYITKNDSSEINFGSLNKEAFVTKNNFANNLLKIFPNPIEEMLNISLAVNTNTKVSIILLDIIGNEVLKDTRVCIQGENSINLNIHQFAMGTYTLKVLSDYEKFEDKFIIVR